MEFEEGSGKFANWACSEVDNLQHHFLSGSLNNTEGPTSAFVTDVHRDLDESPFGGYSGDFAYLENGGFVVEKYIRVQDKDSASGIDRDENLYEVVNLEAWKEWLDEQNNFIFTETVVDEDTGEEEEVEDSEKISERWDNWS